MQTKFRVYLNLNSTKFLQLRLYVATNTCVLTIKKSDATIKSKSFSLREKGYQKYNTVAPRVNK